MEGSFRKLSSAKETCQEDQACLPIHSGRTTPSIRLLRPRPVSTHHRPLLLPGAAAASASQPPLRRGSFLMQTIVLRRGEGNPVVPLKSRKIHLLDRGEMLEKQLHILLDLKNVLQNHCDDDGRRLSLHPPTSPTIAGEVTSVMEAHGVTFVGLAKAKMKKGGKPWPAAVRIDIPASSPMRALLIIWEEIINKLRKDGGGGGAAAAAVNRRQIQVAEKTIRNAYVELYKGLELLLQYSALNIVAFRKILKKFDKVSCQRASEKYMKMVKCANFVGSDKVVRLADDVESIFTRHFAGSDRKKAMKFLRPRQPKESHTVTFLVGLFTGMLVALFVVYVIRARILAIFSPQVTGYVEIIYPIFSMFALLSLHIFMYGCNLWAWKNTRINHNFIFDFSTGSALKPRDAFLVSTGLMTLVVSAMVLHLFFFRSQAAPPPDVFGGGGRALEGVSSINAAVPGVLLVVFTGSMIMPFNICYRSTRYTFLKVLRNIVCSPFYKVMVVDFFLADQLTSQVPLLRHIELTTCTFVSGRFKSTLHSATICRNNPESRMLTYIISFLPYYWRAMQCARRYVEEGHDATHLANGGKYVSAMLAAAARCKYAVYPTHFWLGIVVISSTVATLYQLYWDFFKDWGLFNFNSKKNPLLRDELVLKNKTTYYIAIVINFVLRLAWLETVLGLRLGPLENRLVELLMASLEIIRRGHWNFYRLENEHLNNVGNFRAVKNIPLTLHAIRYQE